MTVRKTEWLPDGSCIEYEANPGAEPKVTLNGKPITMEHYNLLTSEKCCNGDCQQGRNCPNRKNKSLIEFIKGLFR